MAGGSKNQTTALYSTIAGGSENRATNVSATISGGFKNQAAGNSSTIGGGADNQTTATATGSVIGGGSENQTTALYSTIAGGSNNKAEGNQSTVGGGSGNQATGEQSTISGGDANKATNTYSTVGGGRLNHATGRNSTVAGGYDNHATGNGSFAAGVENRANTANAVAVGKKNIIEGTNSAAIGSNNTVAQDKKDVFILGSNTNTTNAQSGSVLLGNKTVGKQATAVSDATVGNLNLTGFAGASAENGVVSVGSEGGERQIVNVGAGEISATSTDAVNGSQLYTLATAVSQNKADITKNQADITKNTDNIQNLKAETLGNRADVQELKRKQENDIKEVVSMQNAIAEQADKNKNNIQDLAKAQLAGVTVMEELNKNVEENKRDLSAVTGKAFKNQIDIQRNNDSIEDLYEANNENVERLTQVDNNVFVNRLNIKELERKQENDIKDVVDMQNAIAEQADKNKNNIQDLAKAQLAGVTVMEELNKNVEANKADIAKNQAETLANRVNIKELKRKQENDIKEVVSMQNAIAEQADKNKNNIQDLAKAQLAGVTVMEELNKNVEANKADIANNTDSIAKNKADIDNNINNIYELAQQQDQHGSDIKTLAKASSENTQNIEDLAAYNELQDAYAKQQTDAIDALNKASSENTDSIAKNKADADAKFKGVQTDIANNKITLAQHTRKIDDNQQAIEAKLGGKADLQKLAELKTSVDKNQADIAANKADTDASFETLTKNQNTLIEQGEAQDALIAQNQTDITANKTAIEQNVNRTVVNGFEIEKNKAGIAQNKQELIIQNNRFNRIDETNNRQDQKIDQLGYALKEQGQYLNSRISAVERQTAGGIANAIAIATLPSPNRAGEHHVLFGSGYHNGQAAVSLGAAGSSDTGKSTYKIGLSWSDAGGLSGGVGGSYRWK
ncbi:YadA-like family protein [Moraxella catarrhalis]|uniref:YadA-like family protein n=1 Tax=Moraxella catarrhalis TaxID=480 RepID=UPI0039B6FC55